VGGGFSGVEVAGHIADLMQAIRRLYQELENVPPRVVLLQKGGHRCQEASQQRPIYKNEGPP
jgi:NADH dehydrogenase FAD-containing subunit